MTTSAAPLMLKFREQASEEGDAPPMAVPPHAQSPEERCLVEGAREALHAKGHGSLRGIEVGVHARMVILNGPVPSYYLKQVAQETVLSVSGVDQVRNNLEVARPR